MYTWLRTASLCVFLFSFMSLSGGCTSSYGNHIDKDSVKAIEKGVTTRDEVERAIGAPDGMTILDGGKRVLMWNYYETNVGAKNFIPFVGLVKSGADTKRQMLQVWIGPDNKVIDYELLDRVGEIEGRGVIGGNSKTTERKASP